jgi:hypothetical protein
MMMTEAEWLTCAEPIVMLEFLRGNLSSKGSRTPWNSIWRTEGAGPGDERKFRLFASASFRRLVALLPDPRQRRGIEIMEELAEGTVSHAEHRRITAEVRGAIPPDDWIAGSPPTDHLRYVALMLYREFCSSSTAIHAVQASAGLEDGAGERCEQARLMRCIFGNPFRPVILDQTWRTSNVMDLARGIYDERAFDLLSILADALEESGCHDAEILDHCRGPRTHARGCWLLDLVLGKS